MTVIKRITLTLVGIITFSCAEKNPRTQTINRPENTKANIEKSTSVSQRNYEEFYEDGKIKIKGTLDENGERSGLWTSYYPNGKKWSESHYVKGKSDGHIITYYPNGNIRYIGEYVKNKQVGEWVFYDENGKVTETQNFSNHE